MGLQLRDRRVLDSDESAMCAGCDIVFSGPFCTLRCFVLKAGIEYNVRLDARYANISEF